MRPHLITKHTVTLQWPLTKNTVRDTFTLLTSTAGAVDLPVPSGTGTRVGAHVVNTLPHGLAWLVFLQTLIHICRKHKSVTVAAEKKSFGDTFSSSHWNANNLKRYAVETSDTSAPTYFFAFTRQHKFDGSSDRTASHLKTSRSLGDGKQLI